MLYEVKNISTTNVGLPKVLLRIGASRIIDGEKVTDAVRGMEKRGLISITEYDPNQPKKKSKEEKKLEEAKDKIIEGVEDKKEDKKVEEKPEDKKDILGELKDQVLDNLTHKKKVNTVDKIVQNKDGSIAGYKPAEVDNTVTKHNDYDYKPDLQKAGDIDKHSADSLSSLKIADLRKVGDDLGVKSNKKGDLIKKILEKQE